MNCLFCGNDHPDELKELDGGKFIQYVCIDECKNHENDKMKIEIWDLTHIRIYGENSADAHDKALLFFNTLIGENGWKSYQDGLRSGDGFYTLIEIKPMGK